MILSFAIKCLVLRSSKRIAFIVDIYMALRKQERILK